MSWDTGVANRISLTFYCTIVLTMAYNAKINCRSLSNSVRFFSSVRTSCWKVPACCTCAKITPIGATPSFLVHQMGQFGHLTCRAFLSAN